MVQSSDPSKTDIKKKIEKANKKLEELSNLKQKVDELKKDLEPTNIEAIKTAIREAEEETDTSLANKKAEAALKLFEDYEGHESDIWKIYQPKIWKWGWGCEILLGIVALGVLFKITSVPTEIYYWALLGAIAYIVFSISIHYKDEELDIVQLFFSTARIIQAPILAGAVYLALSNLGSTQELVFQINQTVIQSANMTPENITFANTTQFIRPIGTQQEPSGTLKLVSVLVGLFTESAVGFLRTFAKKLLPESPDK